MARRRRHRRRHGNASVGSGSFDTVTIIAALNHIPNRAAVINECRRVLRPGGRVVITMLTPRTSRVWHWLRAPWDADQRERGMQPGEVFGFTTQSCSTVRPRRIHAAAPAAFHARPQPSVCLRPARNGGRAPVPGPDECSARPRPRVVERRGLVASRLSPPPFAFRPLPFALYPLPAPLAGRISY